MPIKIKIKPIDVLKTSKLLSAVKHFAFIFLLLSQIETLAANKCSNIFSDDALQPISSKVGALFLHEKDSKLHTSLAVEKVSQLQHRLTGTRLTKPIEKINSWLNYLSRLSVKAEQSPRTLQQLSEVLYKQFTIKPEEVPQSYYDLQVKIARERGHGNIEVTSAMKAQLTETLVKDQRASLDYWTAYLVSKDTSMYPMWLKYWMFTSMTKLSKYDASMGTFGTRTKETVAPFPELNREALAYVADIVLKKLNKESLSDIHDPALLKLLEGMSFAKIYGRTLFNIGVGKEGQFKTNEGRWVVFKQGSDHMPLVKSLEGRNTGWCTAGESTAKSQLAEGDFHVYYSLDHSGNPTVPRVAMRMSGSDIAEVRGVSANQNLDPQINQSPVVSLKLNEFGSKGDRFRKKDNDMRVLTRIESKHIAKIPLSKQELLFLYEKESKIEGFGYLRDPRIDKIKSERDEKADLIILLDHKYTREQISITEADVLSGAAKIHFGDLFLDLSGTVGIKLPEIINGSIYLGGLSAARDLKLPETINGSLRLSDLETAQNLKLPETINGRLHFDDLTTAEGLVLPKGLSGSLNLGKLISAKGLKLPETLNAGLNLGRLTSAEGLILPKVVKGTLNLEKLVSAENLKLPDSIEGDLNLNGLVSAKGLVLPENLNGALQLNHLTSAEGLKLPKSLRGSLVLDRIVSAEGLILPEKIQGDVYLGGLTSAVGLKFPTDLGGSLNIGKLQSAEKLQLPEVINGNLLLGNLTSATGITWPKTVRGNLDLSLLKSSEGLTLPDVVGGLRLSNLKSGQGLKMPLGVQNYSGPGDLTTK